MEILKFLFVCFLACGVFFYRRNSMVIDPLEAVKPLYPSCEISTKWSTNRVSKSSVSYDWCKEKLEQKPILKALMNHMKVHFEGPRGAAVTSAEFGSNVRLIYYAAEMDFFMLNPKVELMDDTLFECTVVMGDGTKKTVYRPKTVIIKYFDKDFKYESRVFTKGESCLLQSVVESMSTG